jgi:hypothetical protein
MTENRVTKEQVDAIISKTEVFIQTVFDKVTIVVAKLPNGFVMVESSGCIDPANYDEELGVQLCLKRIEDQIWKFEGYKKQDEVGDIGGVRSETTTAD